MSIFKFDLGAKVEDVVTGYKGVVIHRTEYLNGCIRYGVQTQELKDGKTIESEMFDEQQLTAVTLMGKEMKIILPDSTLDKKNIVEVAEDKKPRTGGDRPGPTKRPDIH